MADEENLSYKAIRVTDGGGIAVPAEPRRDLRALRRAYEEGTHRDIVALKKRARRVWKKLKKFGIHETVVLDASFGWWGTSENANISIKNYTSSAAGGSVWVSDLNIEYLPMMICPRSRSIGSSAPSGW